MKLLPSRCTFCIHHAPVYSSLSFKATYIMCMFKRNLPPAHLAEWPGSFMCHCCNTGVERLLKQESEQKVDWRRKFSHRSRRGIEPATFRLRSSATERSTPPFSAFSLFSIVSNESPRPLVLSIPACLWFYASWKLCPGKLFLHPLLCHQYRQTLSS